MRDEKDISPLFKQVLELGPTIVFFVLYLRWRDETFTIAGTSYSGFIAAAIAFVPILLAAMAVLWLKTGKLSRLQVFTVVLVLVSSGLTAWFNDERFFKMKTTVVYGLFACLLAIGLLRGQSYLAFMLDEAIPMSRTGWMILTRRLMWMFACLAVGNEIVWRTMSTDAWVKIETFVFPLLLMGFLAAQFMILRKYMEENG